MRSLVASSLQKKSLVSFVSLSGIRSLLVIPFGYTCIFVIANRHYSTILPFNTMERNTYPTAYQQKILWRALTGVCIFVLAGLLIALIWLASEVLGYLQPVLIPLAVAGIIGYLLDPVVAWFQKKGMSRLRAVLCVFGSFIVGTLVFAAIIIPPMVREVSAAVGDRHELGQKLSQSLYKLREVDGVKSIADYLLAPAALDDKSADQVISPAAVVDPPTDGTTTDPAISPAPVKNQVPFTETRLGAMLTGNTDKITSAITSILSQSTSKILGYFGLIIGFIMIPIYLYYFLTQSASIKANWKHYVPLKASKFKTEVTDTLNEINGYLIAFFRGQVLVAFIDGILVGIALMIFGLPYGLVIGVLMAFLGIIPFVGNVICLIPACIIAYLHFSIPENQGMLGDSTWAYVGAVVAIFLIVQQINSLVTAPKIVGDSVGLHPMTVIFSMLFWSLILGGFVGALLAVPMTAAIKVIFVRYVWERKVMDNQKPLSDEDDSDADETLEAEPA